MHQAITLALQNSRDLKLARVQYNVAANEAGVDRAAFRPNLYTGAGLAYTHGFPSLPGGGAPSVFQLDYQQTVFDPWLKGQQKAAEDRAKNQKLEMDHVRDDVIVRTATEYLELAKVQHSLDLMRTERTSAEKILEALRERVAANQELPIELTRSQLALARINEQTIKLEDREETLEEELRDLTGIPDTQSIQAEQQEPSFAVDQSESDIEDLALQNDQSVAEAENEREARQHILRGAHLSYFPSIDIVGQYSVLSKFNNYNEFYNKFERNNVNVGVQITIPLLPRKPRRMLPWRRASWTKPTCCSATSGSRFALTCSRRRAACASSTPAAKWLASTCSLRRRACNRCRRNSTRAMRRCSKSSRRGLMKATNGSRSWTPISPASRPNSTCSRPPAS